MLLYDFDADKLDAEYGDIFVRSMPHNNGNQKIKKGIENLLPSELFADHFYEQKEKSLDDGGSAVTRTLKKVEFCSWVCETRRTASDFEKFRPLLNMLREILSIAAH